MYTHFLKKILFLFSPECAHRIVFGALRFFFRYNLVKNIAKKNYVPVGANLSRRVFGLDFPNPVGLAAGLDKNAEVFEALGCLGFGHVEIGTVTPRPQPGNPKPRLFRLPADEALINRMGFNNEGADAIALSLKKRKPGLIIGGNIGKNKDTPNEKAFDDYAYCFRTLFECVDYFVVNVSSPNTPGLRALQEKEPLKNILSGLMQFNHQLATEKKIPPKPVLLKIAPDLSDAQLDDIIEIVKETRLAGVIATNTTITRNNLLSDRALVEKAGAGGLSGKPLTSRSTEVIRYLVQKSGHAFPVIGVGGIHSPEDALEKFNAGASLIQLYTGFIYKGPGLIKQICNSAC